VADLDSSLAILLLLLSHQTTKIYKPSILVLKRKSIMSPIWQKMMAEKFGYDFHYAIRKT
jgi:hypothetical protein